MRCPACQVDLNENASLCPLCGEPADDIAPLIAGTAYQDYPSYEYKRFSRNVSLIFFFASAIGILLGAGLEPLFTGRLRVTPYLAFIIPCVWAVLIRPKMNGSLSVGNFLLGAVFTISLLLFWVGYLNHLPFTSTLASGVAILTLGAASVLLLATLLRRKNPERHLVFLMIFMALSIAEFGAALWEGRTSPLNLTLSACALGLSLINLIVLCAFCGKTLLGELKARFHF